MSGAAFQCMKCGNCCRPRGYVRLSAGELDGIAAGVGLAVPDFTRRYTRLTDDRAGLSLVERSDGACVFLTPANECEIQGVKPRQCRDFPLNWSYAGFETKCETMKREKK